jgi:O-antigen/teichoic acid export membrane protein
VWWKGTDRVDPSSAGSTPRPSDEAGAESLAASAELDATAEVVAESIATSAPRSGGLLRSGLLVTMAVASANVLNAVFQFVMARILDPAEYSLLVTMFVVVVMVTVPLSGLQAMMAREVASRIPSEGLAGAGAALRRAAHQVGRWIVVVVALTALSAYPLILVLHVDRPLPFIATAVTLAVALPLPVAFGALQGAERFGVLSFVQPVYALLKLAAGVAIGLLGFGASAIMFGVAAATVASMLVVIAPLWAMLRASERENQSSDLTLVSAYTLGTAIGVCGYAVHTNIDILVARISFDATTAGEWAAAAAVAKTILLIPIGVTTVLFPRVAALRDRGRERTHMLAGLGIVAVLGIVAASIYWAFSGTIVDIAFGPKYAAAADWLGPLAFAMVLYALVQVYLFHFLSLGGVRYALTVAAMLTVQLSLFALLHSNPEDLIIVQAIAAGLLVAVGELFHHRRGERVVSGFEPGLANDEHTAVAIDDPATAGTR